MFLNESFYLRMGSTWLIDGIYIFLIAPIGITGFILNMTSLIIYCKLINNANLYKYLIMYSLNGSLICLISSFLFLTYSPRYIDYFLSPSIKIYRCRVLGYGIVSLYFFGNLLDIFISLNRLSIFNNKLKSFHDFNPFKLGILLMIICFSINLRLIVSYDLMSNDDFFNSSSFTYCIQNEFAETTFNKILNIFIISIRDLITLILEIIFSYLLIKSSNKYTENNLIQATININQTRENNLNLTIKKRVMMKKRILYMTIWLSILSIISHLIIAFAFSLFLNNFLTENRLFYFSMVLFGFFSLILKHFLNFFLFYLFDYNFKKLIRKNC